MQRIMQRIVKKYLKNCKEYYRDSSIKKQLFIK